jgi:Xaa-Pro aminopeptidase
MSEHPREPEIPQEYARRRRRVLDVIGGEAIALLQGAPAVAMFVPFRQTNELYYLTGLAVPHAYLLLDGRRGVCTLYLPHRDEHRDRNEGKVLSAEDVEEVRRISGVDEVAPPERLASDLGWILWRTPSVLLYIPLSPAETTSATRDMLLVGQAAAASDPWDGTPSREACFVQLLRERFPQFELRDLTPVLDRERLIKSETEIALLREAARLCGLGVLEAMRSTRPGVFEYQLAAVARFVFLVGGAEGEGYRAIVASGSNTMLGHYYANDSVLTAGDLVLMDYAPDFRYYTSDIGRMWPVSGRFEPWQRELYSFIVRYHEELLSRIRPGATVEEIHGDAAEAMRRYLDTVSFARPSHEEAARRALAGKGHLSHPVGMAVHDVGTYRSHPLESGLVLSVDPTLSVPDEALTVRVEDTVVVTEGGIENLTGFVPIDPDAIEAVMREEGLLQGTAVAAVFQGRSERAIATGGEQQG